MMDVTSSRSERAGLTITTDYPKTWIGTQLVLMFSPLSVFLQTQSVSRSYKVNSAEFLDQGGFPLFNSFGLFGVLFGSHKAV